MADDRMCVCIPRDPQRQRQKDNLSPYWFLQQEIFTAIRPAFNTKDQVSPNYAPVASSVPLVSSEYDAFSQLFFLVYHTNK